MPGPKVDALPTDPGPDRTYKRAISRLLARLCSRSCVQRSARLARGPSGHDIYAIDCGNVVGRGSFAGFNVGEMRQKAVGGISRDHVRMPWGVARINVFFNLFSIVVPCRSRSSSRRNRRPTSTVPKPASAGRIPAPGPVPGHPDPPPHWPRRLDHAEPFDRRARAPQRVAARARPPRPRSDTRALHLRGPKIRFSAVQKRGRGGASCARAVPAPDTTFLAGGVSCRALLRA